MMILVCSLVTIRPKLTRAMETTRWDEDVEEEEVGRTVPDFDNSGNPKRANAFLPSMGWEGRGIL